jgi:hypothetical protein
VYEPVRIEDAAKESLLAQALTYELNMRSGGESGGIGMRRGASPGEIPAVNQVDWPEALPPFRHGRALVSPGGFLWIERYSLPGQPSVVDVVGRDGRKTAEVRLPVGRRVVGFGAGVVYLANADDVGLEWLERYHL